jgi:translation initiation factor IF-2
MNNGRVRIYELSRELNLDNKDILAVCEQLSIAVKSHSSTITESEAERIRAHADKYAVSKSTSNKKHRPENVDANERQGDRKKQQILEIRTHSPRTPGKPSAGDGGSEQSSMLIPPKPPVSHRQQPAEKPKILNRPVRSNATEESLGSEPSATDNFEAPPESSDEFIEQPAPSQPAASPIPPASAPKLVGPPLRPSAAKPDASASKQKDNRPVLKRQKADTEIAPDFEVVADNSVETSVQTAKVAATSPSSEAKPKPKRIPDLQRPQLVRPNAPPTSEEEVETQPSEEIEEEPETLQLIRPTPPRPPKRNKKRVEEEEEVVEFDKAGKAGAKPKRRTKPIEDDEEDFESDLEDLPETVQVSLSIARPAKPKNQRPQPKPTAAVTPATAKKRSSADAANRQMRGRSKSAEAEKKRPEKIVLTGSLTVRELANVLVLPETDIVKTLFFKGIPVNITQTLDMATAKMVAEELGVEVEEGEKESEARKSIEMLDESDLEHLHLRPPVVTIMGHVDHGKTTLLDTIRKTKVAAGEAGGITQHIGAYHVDVEHEGETQQVVFLDTPGHEAFTAMRARGARVTDIAILVVAADDGVQPQTIEAISHAKAAEVPIIVAINKVDKEGANPDRVKQELMEYNLVPEEWGGDAIMVPVSAIKGENLDTLLEMILLVAEVQELQANPDRAAKGTVIEAHLDKARGPVATLLVQNGTLRVGDILVAGSSMGKVRAMVDDRGERVDVASPSFAVEVLGLGDVPAAGDEFDVYENEKEARAVADQRADENRQSRLQQAMASRRVTLNSLSARAQEGELKELNLILKADVQGSVEAIFSSLRQLPQDEVQIRVLLAAPGEITETDVDLAAASDAVIIGFNTTFASGARHAADEAGVDVREYNIIYKLLDDIQGAMEGLLDPELVEEPLGQVEVRAVFPSGKGAVAGCYVLSGKAIRNCKVRVRRGNQIIHQGTLDSLRRMKEDAKEVNAGYECGIGLSDFHDWETSDIIETYRMVTKRRTLSSH